METSTKLSGRQHRQMTQMLSELTAAERALLHDPDFITEDEADIIVSNRRANAPGPRISADEIFAEFGYTPRRRKA
jgi:hypothetical protein